MAEKSDPNCAYHEAGHAVVGEAIEPGCVESLTIQVDNEERLSGSTQFSGEGWEHLEDRRTQAIASAASSGVIEARNGKVLERLPFRVNTGL